MTRTKKKGKHGKAWSDRTNILDMSNERFQAYYKAQSIVPDDEWEEFMHALRQPLPTTFRIAGNRQMAHVLNDAVRNTYVPQLQEGTFEGELLPVPVSIPWYPDGLAWQINVPKKSLRKSTEYKKFHNFLVFETEVGNISRQEAVSMLPPLFLDVEPHHWVIDLCAAPGSKTAQLLEALHVHDGLTTASTPTGLLIANDSDLKRTHLLIHQSARLPSPALMVTNLDASIYPAIRIPADLAPVAQNTPDSEGRKQNWRKDKQQRVLFDRILCDVPCSGDGTIRKNLGIWKTWQPLEGNGLHGLQLRILQRAMKMLKEDGRIVYSTCSLNPIENEAVVAAALNSNPDFELIDVSDSLPALIRRPGLTTWHPSVDRMVNMGFTSHAQFVSSFTSDDKRLPQPPIKMVETHWPPSNVNELGLEHCLRVYPHLQDTGGFFVAVLQKKPFRRWAPTLEVSTQDTELASADSKRPADETLVSPSLKKAKLGDDGATPVDIGKTIGIDKVSGALQLESYGRTAGIGESGNGLAEKGKGKGKKNADQAGDGIFKEHPYTFVPSDEAGLQSCIKRLNLKPDFPASNMYVRNPAGDPIRSLYLVNDVVKAIIQSTDYRSIRLVSAGVKVFGKSEGSKDLKEGQDLLQFRVLSDGLPAVLPYIKRETLIAADVHALRTLLQTYHPLSAAFAPSFASIIDEKSIGSHIICFKAGEHREAKLTHDLILPLWKSGASVSLMIDKKAKSALSLRVFGEDITVTARQAPRNQQTHVDRMERAIVTKDIGSPIIEDEEKDDNAAELHNNVDE